MMRFLLSAVALYRLKGVLGRATFHGIDLRANTSFSIARIHSKRVARLPMPLMDDERCFGDTSDSLDFGGTCTNEDDVARLKKCIHLRRLSLRLTDITDEGLAHIRQLTNLVILDISSSDIGDAGLCQLLRLTKLC